MNSAINTADASNTYASDFETSDNHEPITPTTPSPGIEISFHSVLTVVKFFKFACSFLGAKLYA